MRSSWVRWPGSSILLVAGIGCSEPDLPSATGAWSVEVANGLTMPAPTVTGRTLHYGRVRLADDQTGSLEYCLALPFKATTYLLRWRFLSDNRLEFTYFNTTGSEPVIDSATASGQSMNYRVKVGEADLGVSIWRLRLVAFDPSEDTTSCS
jgi:hypothetical protein